MRKHTVCAVFTTATVVLAAGGALSHARAAAGAIAHRHRAHDRHRPHANRRASAAEAASVAVYSFLRADLSAAEPLALDLLFGSTAARGVLTPRERRSADLFVRQLLAADLHRPSKVRPATDAGGPWLELRMCESGGNYHADTGNGYFGAYQFAPTTWWGLGYTGYPDDAPPAVQDRAARQLEARVGWSAWPVCSQILHLS